MQFTLLYIDDGNHSALEALRLAAPDFHCDLIHAQSFAEAQELLSHYIEVIDVVVTDLFFEKEKLAGVPVIKKLKSITGGIPLIAINVDGKDGGDKLGMLCLKAGATEYMDRSVLNAAHLMHTSLNVFIHYKQKLKNCKFRAAQFELIKPYILIKKVEEQEDIYSHYGAMSWELKAMPSLAKGKGYEQLLYDAIHWQESLVNTLSMHSPQFFFSFVYYFDRNNKSVKVIFLAEGYFFSKDVAKDHMERLVIDLSMLFKSDSNKPTPYRFSPVVEKDTLNRQLKYRRNYYNYRFERKSKSSKKTVPVQGYSTSKSNPSDNTLPLLIPVLPKENFALSQLMKLCLDADKDMVLSMHIAPYQLNIEDKDIIKNTVDNLPKLLNGNTPDMISKYQALYRSHLSAARENLLAVVMLAIEDEERAPGKPMINAISSALLGNHFEIKCKESEPFDEWYMEFETKAFPDEYFRYLYTPENAISLFRLPLPDADGQQILKSFPGAYFNLPEGLPENGILLGRHVMEDRSLNIYLDEKAIRRHVYMLGQTGTGKTTMLKTIFKNLVEKGQGAALIDPHGDLAEEILQYIPEHRKDDVIYFDPTKPDNSIVLNVLKYDKRFPEQKSFIFNELIKIFKSLYDLERTGGPVFERFFRYGILLVMETVENGNLSHVAKVFENVRYLRSLLEMCENQAVISFFESALKMHGEHSYENFAQYITSKFDRFISDDYMRKIFVPESGENIDFREIIDSGKIFIARMSKGKLGDEGLRFLGTILFNRLIMAAYSRENIKPDERKDYTVIVDECQNFVSTDLETALSECRKYKMRMVLANQSFTQLPQRIRNSIIGNVGNLISFRPGRDDVSLIAPYFNDSVDADFISRLPNFKCVARLLQNNIPSSSFVFETVR